MEGLEEELAYANMKITAVDILISIAEVQMGFDRRRKSGSMRPDK